MLGIHVFRTDDAYVRANVVGRSRIRMDLFQPLGSGLRIILAPFLCFHSVEQPTGLATAIP